MWLEDKLKFPDWTRKQIEEISEVRAGNWATANQLPEAHMDSFLNNDARIMALANNIPAVPRDDLDALPEAVWDSQRNSYVYEAWVDRAKAATSAEEH